MITPKYTDVSGATVHPTDAPITVLALDKYEGAPAPDLSAQNLIYAGYRVGTKMTVRTGDPVINSVTGDSDIFYVYGEDDGSGSLKYYPVSENFVDRNRVELLPSRSSNVLATSSFQGAHEPVDSHTELTDFIYLGWRFVEDPINGPITAGDPTLAVTQAYNIEYVYGLDEDGDGTEDKYTIREEYVHLNGSTIQAFTTTSPLYGSTTYTKPVPTISVYAYVGYYWGTYTTMRLGDPVVEDDIRDDYTIKLVYGTDSDGDGEVDTYTMNETYVDIAGDPIPNVSPTQTIVDADTDYNKTPDAITKYVYKGYILDNHPMVLGDAVALTYVHLQLISADHNIKFVYGVDEDENGVEDTFTITEKHVDRRGDVIPTSTDNPVTIPARGAYSNLTPQAFTGYVYIGYEIDGVRKDAPLTPNITKVLKDTEVNIIYGVDNDNDGNEDTHTITEKYVVRNGNSIGQSDRITTKFEREDHTVTIPSFTDWVVLSYKVDGVEITPMTPTYAFNNIDADHEVIVTYGVDKDNDGVEDTFTVKERHVNRNGDLIGSGEVSTTIPALTTFTGANETITDYIYKEYTLASVGTPVAAPAIPTIPLIDANEVITYLYAYDGDGDGVEDEYTVTEKYYQRGQTTALIPNTTQDILAFNKYVGPAAPNLTS